MSTWGCLPRYITSTSGSHSQVSKGMTGRPSTDKYSWHIYILTRGTNTQYSTTYKKKARIPIAQRIVLDDMMQNNNCKWLCETQGRLINSKMNGLRTGDISAWGSEWGVWPSHIWLCCGMQVISAPLHASSFLVQNGTSDNGQPFSRSELRYSRIT